MLIKNSSPYLMPNDKARKKPSISLNVTKNPTISKPSSPSRFDKLEMRFSAILEAASSKKEGSVSQSNSATDKQPLRSGAELCDLVWGMQEKIYGEEEYEPFQMTYAEYFSYCYESSRRAANGEEEVVTGASPKIDIVDFKQYAERDMFYGIKGLSESQVIPHIMSPNFLWEMNEKAKGSADYPDNFYAMFELYNNIDWSEYIEVDEEGKIKLDGEKGEAFDELAKAFTALSESHLNDNWKNYTDMFDKLLGMVDKTQEKDNEKTHAQEWLDKLKEASAPHDETLPPKIEIVPLDMNV